MKDLTPAQLAEADRLFQDNFKRLVARHPYLKVDVNWELGIAILGHLQLALRHPGNDGISRQMVREFCDELIAKVEAVTPMLAALLRMGDDPQYDQGSDRP